MGCVSSAHPCLIRCSIDVHIIHVHTTTVVDHGHSLLKHLDPTQSELTRHCEKSLSLVIMNFFGTPKVPPLDQVIALLSAYPLHIDQLSLLTNYIHFNVPYEQAKNWKRQLDRESRKLDRDIQNLNRGQYCSPAMSINDLPRLMFLLFNYV